MNERIIKTGLGPRYVDMLKAVIGQMSDGYWENSPRMLGYYPFVSAEAQGKDAVLIVSGDPYSTVHNAHNLFVRMSDDAVKNFFADKIKFLINEEGLGKWARDNEKTTDYLSYSDPYRVKDCYYAYEILKGRNARKHAEYGDVAESRRPVKIKMVEKAKKNERGQDAATDLDGPACLSVSETTTAFDCDWDGDDVFGNVAIGPADIEKAVAKIIDPKLWGTVKADYDWGLLRETIQDFELEVGSVRGYSWYSPSQYFEDPGDGGYKATLDLSNEPLSEAIDTLLYTFGQLVLDTLTGEPKYIEYGEDAKVQMLEEAKKDAAIQTRLQELGLDFSAIDALFSLDNSQAAQDIYNLLWKLDGSEDSD